MSLRKNMGDLRGAVQLACDATAGITDAVEHMHGTVRGLTRPLGTPKRSPSAGLAGLVYGGIRLGTRVTNQVTATLTDAIGAGQQQPERTAGHEALVAVLNGLWGDHLALSNNPLATPMSLRLGAAPGPGGGHKGRRWLFLVHGICMHDRQWMRPENGSETGPGHDHGQALANELGVIPVYLRYNSGLAIAENGAALSEQLEQFMHLHLRSADQLMLLGYSMGGLLIRKALLAAEMEGHQWPDLLVKLAFLGTPHFGAPLATGGFVLDNALEVSPYSAAIARLGKARSQGLHDLREGMGTGLSEVPPWTQCLAIAGSRQKSNIGSVNHWVGDGLVSRHSALALGPEGVDLPASGDIERWTVDAGHLQLLSDPQVYERLRGWFV